MRNDLVFKMVLMLAKQNKDPRYKVFLRYRRKQK